MMIIKIFMCILTLSLGLFIAFNPEGMLQIQKRFYEKINWNLEPISLKKEIRNTRIFGLIIIVTAILWLIVVR